MQEAIRKALHEILKECGGFSVSAARHHIEHGSDLAGTTERVAAEALRALSLLDAEHTVLRDLVNWVDATGIVRQPAYAGMDIRPLLIARAALERDAQPDAALVTHYGPSDVAGHIEY